MLKKNTAGQNLTFCLVSASTGAALTGATVTARRCIDGAAQAAATGTVTEPGNGQYNFAPSQADTNGDLIGYLFTAAGAIPVNLAVRTTAADLADAVRLGLTALPNVAAGANGGLPTGDASGRVLLQPTQTGVTIPTVTTVGTVTTLTNLPAIPNNWLTAAGIAAGALNGKGDWNTSVPPSAVQIRQEIDTNSVGLAAIFARTDVATSSRLAAASYTAPDNTSITWLKNYLGGDRSIDTGVTPWAEVVTIAGTSTELTRKKLRDVAGVGVTATTTVIGSAKDS